VYLQEIGRIRLLRPDEEIELARKIADLLQLEELAARFEVDHGHYPDTKEWAVLVEMPVIKFRRRLMLGRRAKEDGAIQPAPGGVDRQEIHEPGPVFPGFDPGRQPRPDPRRREV
jgi:hypothetical protein